MAGRYLITTADERSWKFDRPVLFLGGWCRRYGRRSVWSVLDAELAPPFGIAPGEKVRNTANVQRIAAELLPELTYALNTFHGVERSRRYWQILLGHWLLRCVSVVFNRYHTIQAALTQEEISGTATFASSSYTLATPDSAAFIWACNDDVWNHMLYAHILEFIGGVEQERVADALGGTSGFTPAAVQPMATANLKLRIAAAAATILPRLSRQHDAVLISTYLPLKERLLLELSLGQIPQRWETPPLHSVSLDRGARKRFALDASPYEGMDRFIRTQLSELIPMCYLEGYTSLTAQAAALPWPSRPEFIFTSNRFDTDELFKAWAADQVERGTRYVTGQHGNNYGTHVWEGAEFWPERATPDRFITWGWRGANHRDVPAFIFKTAGKKQRDMRPRGGLLLVEVAIPHRVSPHDTDAEFAMYQDEQFRFVQALPSSVCERLTVRLHGEYRKHQCGEEQRWAAQAPHVVVEKGLASIGVMVNSSRLVVHSYDSTGILETLALDVPTMCFWNGGFEHLLPSAKPYYELLRDAGIFHGTPEAAASAVAAHWDDVDGWWQSVPVQEARRAFCDQYARTSPHPIRLLKALLREASVAGGSVSGARHSLRRATSKR